MIKMRLWIDDVRPAPEDYIWVKSVNAAWGIIKPLYTYNLLEDKTGCVEISLDHDAGEYFKDGGNYIKILDKLEYCAEISTNWDHYIREYTIFNIHSANPVG